MTTSVNSDGGRRYAAPAKTRTERYLLTIGQCHCKRLVVCYTRDVGLFWFWFWFLVLVLVLFFQLNRHHKSIFQFGYVIRNISLHVDGDLGKFPNTFYRKFSSNEQRHCPILVSQRCIFCVHNNAYTCTLTDTV